MALRVSPIAAIYIYFILEGTHDKQTTLIVHFSSTGSTLTFSMTLNSMSSILQTAVALVLLVVVLTCWVSKPRIKLPPGPIKLPVLGSLHHLPLKFQEYAFWDWRKKYGVCFLDISDE